MLKMSQSFVPVILLAIVALSSSNVLPIMSLNQLNTELGVNSQNDNTFSNTFLNRNILNDIFYKVSIGTTDEERFPRIRKLPDLKLSEWDNNNAENDLNNILKNENSYNGEGFRKDQWHNYPRQLDRLHKYLYDDDNTVKRSPKPDDIADYTDEQVPKMVDRNNDLTTNELLVYSNNDNTPNVYDTAVATTNPFLILKIRLACLSNKLESNEVTKDMGAMLSEDASIIDNNEEEKIYTNENNPSIDAVKVKREDISTSEKKELTDDALNGKRAVKKRIFSLWSRLQSLNPKGHELQHRRHLHTFYGLPNSDGGGVISAETRATLMRPPGSPLRWG